jgi:hypothetical protein
VKRAWVVVGLLLCSCAAFSMDRDVKRVATALEQECGLKFHKLPWIARAVMKPALWGRGVKLDILAFEGETPERADLNQVESAMKKALGEDWSWFIRSTSKKTNERAVIFVREAAEKFDTIIVSIEPGEAAIVKLRMKQDEMKKWMDEPDEMALHKEKSKEKAKHKTQEEGVEMVKAE